MASGDTKTIEGLPNYGETNVRDLNEALRELHETETFTLERTLADGSPQKVQTLVMPAGRRLQSIKTLLDEFLLRPERRRGTAQAFTLASFIDLIGRFGDLGSVVFVNPDEKKPSFSAVFDYHPANSTADGGKRLADWGEHRAAYAPTLSREWESWLASNATFMDQAEFAHFIESHATNLCVANLDDSKLKTFADLVQGVWADPVDLIQLSRGIELSVDINVKSAVKLQSGEIAVRYDQTHKDGGGQPIKVPSLFQVQLPVFRGEDWYRLAAKLRYRVSGTKMTWAYELVQPDLAFRGAVDEMAAKLKAGTDVPIFFGAP